MQSLACMSESSTGRMDISGIFRAPGAQKQGRTFPPSAEEGTTHFQHNTLDHDLHAVWRYTSDLVDRIFEESCRLIGIELHIVHLTGVLDFYRDGCHDEME